MKKRGAIGLSVLLVLTVALAACSGKNADNRSSDSGGTSKPLSNDPITLKIVKLSYPDVGPAAKDKWMWQEYEKMSNVRVDWTEIPSGEQVEKKNALMNSGDYPDAFYGPIGFSTDELVKYGGQGIFIPLEDLIDRYAPNLSKLFRDKPDIKKALTMPDGHIYALPYVESSNLYASIRFYMNKKFLDNVGMQAPTTTDELIAVLEAFRDKDANGNGQADDEYPLALPDWMFATAQGAGLFEQEMYGSFGMGNGGLQGAANWIYKDKDGQLKTIFNDEKLRQLWKYLKKLWDDKLLHPETLSGLDFGKWTSLGANDQVGLYSFVHSQLFGPDKTDDYIAIDALQGPDGDQVANWVDFPVRYYSSFIITKSNKEPERSIQWADYFYGEEGSMFGFFGKEGETYSMADGKPQYVDKILNDTKGAQIGAFQYIDNNYGGYYPYVEPPEEYRAIQGFDSVEDYFKTTSERLDRYLPEEIWPQFNPTSEESTETIPILTDINKFIYESRVKFISGDWNLDGADWDNYVQTLDKMGAKRYLEIKQAQYERFKNS